MSRWFRFYDDAINDPKILRLSDANFRAWVTLLCLASKNDGLLPSTNDIALVLRLKPAKVAEWLAMLTASGLLDNDNGLFSPHNWNARQFKSDKDPTAADRKRRQRDKENVTRDITDESRVMSHPPETEQRQITDTEQRKTRASALAEGWPSDFREQFWEKYPNKVGKPKALAKLEQCMKRGVQFDAIMAGLDGYIHAKPADRAWLNPETFINQERWADQPAAVTNGRRTVQQAADDLLTQLRAFDEPAPDGLCDGTGQNAVRLLPPH